MIGAIAGLATTATIGHAYQPIDSWWLTAVPTDTSRAAALLVAYVVGFASVTIVLCVAALTGSSGPYRRRNRVLGLGILSGVVGGLVGTMAGGLAAAVDMAQQTPFLPDIVEAANGGAGIGLLVGSLVGVAVGGAVAILAVVAEPLPPVPDPGSR